jgi:hypothetical protein
MLYNEAQEIFKTRRKRCGKVSLGHRVSLSYDAANDVFKIGFVVKHERIPNDPNYGWRIIPERERVINPFAVIERTQTVFTTPSVLSKYEMEPLGLHAIKIPGIKTMGYKFLYNGSVAEGNFPIYLSEQGVHCRPLLHRTETAGKRKELIDRIKVVRRLLRARTKLGAFDHISGDKTQLAAKVVVSNGALPTALEAIKSVREEDITSFYPLILVCHSRWYTRTVDPSRIVMMFNRMIAREKERMLLESGTIVYT